MVSELFDAKAWRAATGVDFTDITYHRPSRWAPCGWRSTGQRCGTRSGHTVDGLYRALKVVPHAELERSALCWAKRICGKSPTAQRMLKFAFT